VDVAAHLGGLLEPFADRARSVGVRLEREIAPAGLRLIDPDRLAQVLANLVENALRFTPETGSVTVRLAAPPGRLVLTVTDTGPGIEPEDAGRIFERFYVARKYRGVRPEGSGLGLSIVERLVAAMGGAVSAVSGPAGGTVFTVDLPASPA
jgi:two-component system OmpR family sensor kinase